MCSVESGRPFSLESMMKETISEVMTPSVQIGSYFGSVLQTVDVDGDTFTDLLLVGAPMFMGSERNEQGQVYVYKLNQVQKI